MLSIPFLFAAATLAVVFFAVRPRFLEAMVAARLSEVHGVALELDRLVLAGELDKQSAFYQYFHWLAVRLGTLSPQRFPGPVELLILARKKPRLVEDEARLARRELGLAASAELTGRYRGHQDIVGKLVFSTFDALRYRSLLVWLVAMLAAQFIAAFRVLDFVMDLLEPRPVLQERHAA